VTYGLLLAAFGAGAVAGAFAGATLRERFSGEGIVAGSSLAFALSALVVALVPSLPVALPALAVAAGPGSWPCPRQHHVQLRTPRWVVGRAMSVYQAASFGGLAIGAWGWGLLADRYGLPASLLASALALGAGALLGRALPMPAHEAPGLDLLPVRPSDRRTGSTSTRPAARGGERRVPGFAGRRSGLPRRRPAAAADAPAQRRPPLGPLQDAADPETWIERFESPTWLDRLRLRHRMTVADQEVEARALSFHRGPEPPVLRHLLAHVPSRTTKNCRTARGPAPAPATGRL
jgi:hypothetical protein